MTLWMMNLIVNVVISSPHSEAYLFKDKGKTEASTLIVAYIHGSLIGKTVVLGQHFRHYPYESKGQLIENVLFFPRKFSVT